MIKSLVPLALLISSLLSGCVSTAPPPPSSLPTNFVEERITTVENHIPVKGWFQWTEKTIIDRMEHYNVPGVSIAVINNHKIEWAKGYGTVESGSDIPVTHDTLFQAASVGKSLTSAAAMHLVENEILSLDEDVNNKLMSWEIPENRFTQKEKVTLRRLLSHTAGMTVGGFRGYAEGEKIPSLIQILNGAPPANNGPIRVNKTPGKAFRYSGGGFQVVQQLFEDVQKEPFSIIMQKSVLIPCGMTSSSYELMLTEDRKVKAATAHDIAGRPAMGKWHNLACFGAGGGLWTTPTDLAKFGIEISEAFKGKVGNIISPQSAKVLLSPYSDAGELGRQVKRYLPWACSQVKYGLGFVLCGEARDLLFLHPGHNLPGYRSLLVMMPEKEQGIAIMVNGEKGNGLILEIFYSFAHAYGWVHIGCIGPSRTITIQHPKPLICL